LSSVKPGSVLPPYSFSFWSSVICAFFGLLEARQHRPHAAISMVWGAMCLPVICGR
jgi:hypothetical protein